MTTKVHLIKAVMNFRTQTSDVVFTTANGALTGVCVVLSSLRALGLDAFLETRLRVGHEFRIGLWII